MRDEFARLVYPVLNHGLQLKKRLEQGDVPDLDTEQAVLKGLLLSESEARRLVDFGGDGVSDSSVLGGSRTGGALRRGDDHFLGVRYALVAWLDEIFILDSPWESNWNERKLEVSLYGTNDRAWKFWEQARRAEARPGSDALEVFYLSMMLGFRGDMRGEPEKLQSWAAVTQARISKNQPQEWPVPPESEPPSYVPPLRGREAMQRMVMAGAVVLLILIPVVSFVVMRQLSQ